MQLLKSQTWAVRGENKETETERLVLLCSRRNLSTLACYTQAGDAVVDVFKQLILNANLFFVLLQTRTTTLLLLDRSVVHMTTQPRNWRRPCLSGQLGPIASELRDQILHRRFGLLAVG